MLKFVFGNGKLSRMTAIFNLPAGHSCPFADQCFSKADRLTGKVTDGPNTVFRCYAASLETRPAVRNAHWHNFDLIRAAKSTEAITDLIAKSLPEAMRYRIHSSGDFFSQEYFDAWLNIAKLNPDRLFYAYTKALPYWIARKDSIPANFKLIASYGGKKDKMIAKHGLRSAKVVPSVEAAIKMELPIDTDDSIAYGTDKSFALTIHGTQPAGSEMSKAWQKIKAAKHPLTVRAAA